MTVRKPVPPSAILGIFHGLIWLLRWLVVPALLVPVAAAVAVNGWQGFRPSSLSRRYLYWLEVCALLLLAVRIPLLLLSWMPKISSFGGEMASFIVRAGFAYLLFVGALLVLELLTSRGRPLLSQPATVVSP
jgi:hypothetical protein